MSIERHEGRIDNHELRIRLLEVNQAVLIDNVNVFKKILYGIFGTLSGIFLLQLANFVMNGGLGK